MIVRTVGPEERQRRHEVGVVVRRCCCSVQTGNEVIELLCGWYGGTVMMELCAFWSYESCVVFVGLLVGFRWTSGGQSSLD